MIDLDDLDRGILRAGEFCIWNLPGSVLSPQLQQGGRAQQAA